MEKFAVDLDKVLDDFELNEDEQENEAHYDRLHLEFRRESHRDTDSHLPLVGVGNVRDWNDGVHHIPTEVRGLPDGQHDDETSAVCRRSTSDMNTELDFPNCLSQDCPQDSDLLCDPAKVENNTLAVCATKPDVTSDVNPECEKLWPNLSSQDLPSISKVPLSNMSQRNPQSHLSFSSNSLPDVECEGASSLPKNQSLSSCPLDVLPIEMPLNVGSLGNHEGNHPDILDRSQSSQEESSSVNLQFQRKLAVTECQSTIEGMETKNLCPSSLTRNVVMQKESHDIQKGTCLLPDLMPSANAVIGALPLDNQHTHDISNPAVVTENTLSYLGRSDEPAIVQESQSNSQIPELINIHQSAEENTRYCKWLEKYSTSNSTPINSISECHDPGQESDKTKDCDYPKYNLVLHHSDQTNQTLRILPDVSASCSLSHSSSEIRTDESNQCEQVIEPVADSVVRFNPCSNIDDDDDDLDTELQELEEEQMRLQGAYSNSGLQIQLDNMPFLSTETYLNSFSERLPLTDRAEPSYEYLTDDQNECISDNEPFVKCDIPSSNCATDISIKAPINSPEIKSKNIIDEGNSPEFPEQSKDSLNNNNSNLHSSDGGMPDIKIVETENKEGDTSNTVACNNVAVDTLSLTSNTTDTESASPENDQFAASASSKSLPSEPQSPSRDTPGTLVTAVYDDTQSKEDVPQSSGKDFGIGAVAPFWIPDEEAPKCQECGFKFTVLKRRHHCRGCGRVLCASCCHFKAPLPYMDFKEARVCATCLHLLTEAAESEKEQKLNSQCSRSPNPNNPMEYCSRIPPQQQVGAVGSGPPPTVMVPVGVLKRETSNSDNGSSIRPRGSKQVIFSDGIRPGGDLTELGGQMRPPSPYHNTGRCVRRVIPDLPGSGRMECISGGTRDNALKQRIVPFESVAFDTRFIPSGRALPPILMKTAPDREYTFESNPDSVTIEEQLRGEGEPVVFALQKNLTVLVKLIHLDCCVGFDVWNVSTRGLCNVGQEELVILLEVAPNERSPPPHLFSFIHTVYQQANQGNLVTEMGHTIFTEPEGFLGSKDHGGFLYIRPTYQCLNKLVLPPSPYIFAVLIQKWETPWAKVFPLRLMLRLGAEFRYYPCPLISTRNRKPVYSEIGNTIMNLLVDFRNYAYTIAVIQGFVIHMEEKKTTLIIPRNRYEQVLKAVNNSNDHVLALGANFSFQADSHLVTVEDDDGHYTTQAINIQSKPRRDLAPLLKRRCLFRLSRGQVTHFRRKLDNVAFFGGHAQVTGASFVVFNGALKSNVGLKAKSSIVEDGLMVQVAGDLMANLLESLRNMKDFDIPCGPTTSQPDEFVSIRWVQDDKNFNVGIKSPIDGRQMDGVPSVKIHSGTDYVNNEYLIRWTEVFIIQGETTTGSNDINISRLAECLARACCVALTPHLALLYEKGPNRVGLRTTIHQDNVEYEAGKGENRLLPVCMNELDTELIPVIHRAASSITDQAIILELVFHIMEQ